MPTPTVPNATVPVVTGANADANSSDNHNDNDSSGNTNAGPSPTTPAEGLAALTPTVSPGQFSTISSLSGSALKAKANGKINGNSAVDSPVESDVPTAIDSPADEYEPCPEENSRTPADGISNTNRSRARNGGVATGVNDVGGNDGSLSLLIKRISYMGLKIFEIHV
jgi:hypothetical protein